MRQLLWTGWIAGLVACGGDKTTDDDGTDSDTADTNTTITGPDPLECGGVPTFSIAGMECTTLGNAWTDITNAMDACETVSDCRVVHPPCEHWTEVSCYYAVNTCAGLDERAFAAEAADCAPADPREQCKCGAPPDVDCVAGQCLFVFDTY